MEVEKDLKPKKEKPKEEKKDKKAISVPRKRGAPIRYINNSFFLDYG